jgi:hypothetical protein
MDLMGTTEELDNFADKLRELQSDLRELFEAQPDEWRESDQANAVDTALHYIELAASHLTSPI